MSRRQLKTDDEDGFLHAFRDELLDNVEYYGVRIEVLLCVAVRRPGLLVRVIAYKKDAEGAEQVYAQVEHPYPSHAATRLHAALYRASVMIGGELSRVKREKGQQDSPAS